MKIYEMVSSNNGSFFLAAEFEKKVAAYESMTGRKLGEYSTHFQSGGKRICIADSGKYFAAASYGRWGISLYDTETGAALWTTKEVKQVQRISFSADETALFAVNNDNKLYALSLTDGSIISVENNVMKIYDDRSLAVRLTGSECTMVWNGGTAKLTDKKVLSICSGNGRIFCSTIRGGIRCFSDSGSVLWIAENKPDEHYVTLCYCPSFDYIIGLGYKFGSARTEPFFFFDVYSASNGDIVYSIEPNETAQHTFIDNGERIVSGTGNVYILKKDGYDFSGKQVAL